MPFVETPNAFTWDNLASTWDALDVVWVRGLIINIESGSEKIPRTISQQVFSFSVQRGKSRDLETTSAGSLSASFRNETRRFDPTNTASDLDGYILPKRPVSAVLDGRTIFSGVVDNWSFEYSVGGDSTASFRAFDAFSIFANKDNQPVVLPRQRSGERVNSVLSQSDLEWPAELRDIEKGNTILEPVELDGTVLSQLKFVEQSEGGFLFVNTDGTVLFLQRNFNQPSSPIKFSDNNDGIPYIAAQLVFGLELFANEVTVENSETSQLIENVVSQDEFGVTNKTFKTGLISVAQLRALGKFVVVRYGQPEFRIEKIEVNLESLGFDDRLEILELELGDIVEVEFTPNDTGNPILLRNRIIGLSHRKNLNTHVVSFAFENLPFGDFFVLDDTELGKLDNDDTVLGF